MKVFARAKINLFLEVLKRRPDGYHDLDTVFQSIALSDELLFEKKRSGFSLTVSDKAIPTGEENLVWRAYKLLSKRFPREVGGVSIHLEKRIPSGAGLGGGSADAAATLKALNFLFELGLADDELKNSGIELGMDVPFCLSGGAAVASGRGELIIPVQRKVDFGVLVVYAGFSISTPAAYGALRLNEAQTRRTSANTVNALGAQDIALLWHTLYNRFEEVLIKIYPVLGEIKKALIEGGCSAALVTGSGSAVCGFAPSVERLKKVASRMRERYPFVSLTHPVNKGLVFQNNAA